MYWSKSYQRFVLLLDINLGHNKKPNLFFDHYKHSILTARIKNKQIRSLVGLTPDGFFTLSHLNFQRLFNLPVAFWLIRSTPFLHYNIVSLTNGQRCLLRVACTCMPSNLSYCNKANLVKQI